MEWIKVLEQIGQSRIRSVTDSLFKFGFIGFTIGSGSAILGKTPMWVPIVIFSFSGLFLLVGLAIFIYFAFKNPEYLRSENFHLRMRSIELLGDKENASNPNIMKLTSITNPYDKVIDIRGERPKSLEE